MPCANDLYNKFIVGRSGFISYVMCFHIFHFYAGHFLSTDKKYKTRLMLKLGMHLFRMTSCYELGSHFKLPTQVYIFKHDCCSETVSDL